MKRLPTILILITILVLPLTFSYYSVTTEDCYVQIVSVSLNRSYLEVGEMLQVHLVYDLYYDPTDPLGIGSVSVSFAVQGYPTLLSSYEFTTLGVDIQETMTFDISPDHWAPNETGQIGVVQVEGWVQDSLGTMTDFSNGHSRSAVVEEMGLYFFEHFQGQRGRAGIEIVDPF